MANIKGQIKRNRQNERRNDRNRRVRAEIGTRTRSAVEAAGTEESAEALQAAITRIDKAAAKGTLHKNTAARKKSRLVARVRRLEAEQA